jgi:NAD(P)-dependent dehydrogenase (short-subunit alcohol dehydrogenase family)
MNDRTTVAVVTGSSSGVGAATVRRLRGRGLHVIGVDVADPVVTDDDGFRHLTADAGDDATWHDVLRVAADEFGRAPTVAVFSAAVLAVGSVVTLTDDTWQRVFHVNVFGPARALKLLVPEMARLGGGSVVFVNSVDGPRAEQNLAAYCASKGAALQLMRAVALDHARQNIRSNAVCPGAIETPFFMRHVDAAPDPAAFLEEKTQRHPMGKLIQPDQVAAMIDFLTSDAADGITGTDIAVDGGLATGFDFYPDQAESEIEVSR